MFKNGYSTTPVVIDFDSCAFEGDSLPDKRGQMPKGACTAEFENDDFGLEMLRKELVLAKHQMKETRSGDVCTFPRQRVASASTNYRAGSIVTVHSSYQAFFGAWMC